MSRYGVRGITTSRMLFVGPALALIALFMIYPIGRSLWMSFQSGRGLVLQFAGFGNVVRLWHDPVFLKALSNRSSSSSCRCRS